MKILIFGFLLRRVWTTPFRFENRVDIAVLARTSFVPRTTRATSGVYDRSHVER